MSHLRILSFDNFFFSKNARKNAPMPFWAHFYASFALLDILVFQSVSLTGYHCSIWQIFLIFAPEKSSNMLVGIITYCSWCHFKMICRILRFAGSLRCIVRRELRSRGERSSRLTFLEVTIAAKIFQTKN